MANLFKYCATTVKSHFILFIHAHMCRVHALDFSCTWLLGSKLQTLLKKNSTFHPGGHTESNKGQTTGAQQTSYNPSSTKSGMENAGFEIAVSAFPLL